MNARKFSGRNSREVLQKVKQALGADAMIIANNAVDDGIEVLALSSQAIGLGTAMSAAGGSGSAGPVAATAAATPPPGAIAGAHEILDEIRRMRSLLQGELAALSVSDLQRRNPVATALLRELLVAGFTPPIARALTAKLPMGESVDVARRRIAFAIEQKLQTAPADDIVERGGVFALVGPTGVGKTTTVAKLAARAVVRYGAADVALLTTDSFRIAGQDQLRIYGKILGVPVHAIKDAGHLGQMLADLKERKLLLIDTMGMSQRDRQVADQATLLASAPAVRRVLLLNATASAPTLDEVVAAYVAPGHEGCIITKIDEAASLAPALDVCLRHRLTLHYVTNGQRVPEDVHLPNRSYLLHRSLKTAVPDAQTDMEALTLMAGTPPAIPSPGGMHV
ncbi:MAG: flagellar biosynthesis protein FlhF [Burkholderiales bacterium]